MFQMPVRIQAPPQLRLKYQVVSKQDWPILPYRVSIPWDTTEAIARLHCPSVCALGVPMPCSLSIDIPPHECVPVLAVVEASANQQACVMVEVNVDIRQWMLHGKSRLLVPLQVYIFDV